MLKNIKKYSTILQTKINGGNMNRTKRRIFECAMKLFAEKGYDATSVEEITAVSGIAKGTLYYHFEKKEDILNMLLEEGMKLLKNSIEIKIKDCNSCIDKIKAVILVQVKVTVKYENFINLVFSEIWGKEEKNKKCRKCVFEYIKILEKIIQEGIEKGEFYDGNVQALASGIFGVTCSSLIYRMKIGQEADIEHVYNGFVDTVVRGLSK